MKEKFCYVAEDSYVNYSSDKDKSYIMPDKRVIEIPDEIRMGCPEILFNPGLHEDPFKIEKFVWSYGK